MIQKQTFLKVEQVFHLSMLQRLNTIKTNKGEKVESTEWFRIVVWNKASEFAEKHLKKGMMIYIEGKLKTRKYEDKKGIERWSTEVNAQNIQILKWKDNEDQVTSIRNRMTTFLLN